MHPPTKTWDGRRATYTPEQDLAIVREVAAAEVHVAGFGETRKWYENAANLLSYNPLFTNSISWKNVQDRYKRLKDSYDAHDNEHHRFSGVDGGESGELANLWMMIREAKDDMVAKKNAEKNERTKLDKRSKKPEEDSC